MSGSSAVSKRRKVIKQKAVELLGGKCSRCGYNKCFRALQFHHVDRTSKKFGIAEKGVTRAWALVQEELKKCILLCANCHAEEEEFLLTCGLTGMIGHC